MILADTSVWIDHLRQSNAAVTRLLDLDAILMHPMILGEIAMGSLKRRATLTELANLPQSQAARHDEVMALIERESLYGLGIDFPDAHLLASTMLTEGARLWTRDRRLRTAAERLDLHIRPWGRD